MRVVRCESDAEPHHVTHTFPHRLTFSFFTWETSLDCLSVSVCPCRGASLQCSKNKSSEDKRERALQTQPSALYRGGRVGEGKGDGGGEAGETSPTPTHPQTPILQWTCGEYLPCKHPGVIYT